MFTFDEYKELKSPEQLKGKTIAGVKPLALNCFDRVSGWVLTFTDGQQIELCTPYDDSSVHWTSVDEPITSEVAPTQAGQHGESMNQPGKYPQ